MINQQKIKVLLSGTDEVNVEQRRKNVERLCCREVKALEYFELLSMRYRVTNAVIPRT